MAVHEPKIPKMWRNTVREHIMTVTSSTRHMEYIMPSENMTRKIQWVVTVLVSFLLLIAAASITKADMFATLTAMGEVCSLIEANDGNTAKAETIRSTFEQTPSYAQLNMKVRVAEIGPTIAILVDGGFHTLTKENLSEAYKTYPRLLKVVESTYGFEKAVMIVRNRGDRSPRGIISNEEVHFLR